MYSENEKLTPTSITEIMETAYIDYSMSVIVARALPDVRDGLKPVQRRILYAMLREGLLSSRSFDKCAGVVGEVLKNYHPHGDTSVYDTLVRMGQDWVVRYPLIAPQGNFGSVDGDPPAAYRYTECKLTPIAEDLLRDIDSDTVDFVPNYKESTTEPSVLPSALPHLLMNGSTGIAVGMTTNIPPHNLGELIDATCLLIDKPQATVDEIIKLIPGPDFPTGGTIAGRKGIEEYMRSGRGIVRIKGTAHVEEIKGGKEQIVITEIPYNVNRANLVTRIAELIREKVFTEISDLRDESDTATRIVIELKRDESSRVVINKIAKHTAFESSFGVIMLALDKMRPKQMNIKEVLECYIEHRREVIYRRTQFLLAKAEDRAHILEGYRIALDNLDEFVRIIRSSENREQAKERLQARFPISDRQAATILEMRLYQLTGLEKGKIEEEYHELMKRIDYLRSILNNEGILLGVIKDELLELKGKYESPRRTRLVEADGEFRMEDVIVNEGCIITVSHNGFIKRTPVSSYRSQKRGGKGVIGTGQHDDDFVERLFTASTHDNIMFFMNNGRVYVEKVYNIPEGTRTSKGRSLSNVLQLQKEEKIATMICVPSLDSEQSLVMATRNGIVKRTILSEYKNTRQGGIIGINIDDDDELIGCRLCEAEEDIILITRQGMSIRFTVNDETLRPLGRATRGVKGVTLKKEGDWLKAIEVVKPDTTLLIAGENGIGKRSTYNEFRQQGRGGSGVIALRTKSTVAGAISVRDSDELMLLTEGGQAVRIPISGIRVIGRTTQGVKLINLADGDRLIGLCPVVKSEEDDETPLFTLPQEELLPQDEQEELPLSEDDSSDGE